MELVAETTGVVEGQLEDRAGEKGQRDTRGRFAKGNTCARGRSGVGSLAAISRMMRKASTDEKILEVCEKIVEKAASGCIGAAKLMFRFLELAAREEECETRGEEEVVEAAAAPVGAPLSTVETVGTEVGRSVAGDTVEAVPLSTVETVPVLVGKEIGAAKRARYRQMRQKWAEKKASRKRKKSKR